MSSRSSQYVEVQLEIGHRATPRTTIRPDGHTHDWTVFVRGPENSNIEHFVEKVVFHLHESFPKPKRVLKEPPYQVQESGYASFELPIEVYFKNKEEPKKICFDYDLYLRLDDAVSHSRREKLTFQNPSNDFKKKLLKAGGVTNETSSTSVKTSGNPEEKAPTQQTQQTTSSSSSSNGTKYSKASVSGIENKKSKTLGVIPSKDKSLNKSQNSTTTSSSNPSLASDKPAIPQTNKQFTDLFGTPIQTKPITESTVKNKENPSKSKFTAIASKGVKNESKSVHKNSSKSSHSSPTHKTNENKSSKTPKELKDSKDSKSKESTKSKREEEVTPSKSKKKSSHSSPKPYDSTSDKKIDSKSSKKRRNSTSSNSSTLTASNESKVHKESQKLSSIKDKDNKKESKRQKNSSKDVNSGVKKQSSTSTKISFSDNNSSTTIEIKSVKKEKTWDSESKKSRTKETKSAKDKLIANTNSSVNSSLSANKVKPKPEPNYLKSPKVNGNKHLKVPKDKYGSHARERSTSLSSDSLTPPPNDRPMNQIAADLESNDSMSPLSSDNISTLNRFQPIRPNRKSDANKRFISDDSDSEASTKQSPKRITHSLKNDAKDSLQNKKDSSKLVSNKRKKDLQTNESNKRLDSSKSDVPLGGPDLEGCVVLDDLMDVQKRISESTNIDLLQRIVDTIEESGLFCLTETTFDFDLMKLDDKTIRKLKSFLI